MIVRRLALAAVLALAVVVGAGSPAGAHAVLERTSPAAGSVLDASPDAIALDFSEPVEVAIGAIRVYDADAARVPTGRPRHPGGRSSGVEVALAGELADGAYVVTWRVTSADGHPVHGAFTFRVGAGSGGAGSGGAGSGGAADRSLVERLLAADEGDAPVGAVFGAARAVLFAAVVMFVGGVAFVTALWPAGWARCRRLLVVTGVVVGGATLLTLALQGAYAAGLGLGDAFRWSTVSAVLGTRYGTASLWRLAVLAVAIPLVALRPLASIASKAVGAVVAVALLATVGWAGHAGAGTAVPVAMALDVAHLAAVSVWVGGLAFLVLGVLGALKPTYGPERAQNEAAAAAAEVVAQFSRVAFWAVMVIVATGVAQSARQVGGDAITTAVTGTDYGRLLLAKVALVAGMVALAWSSRRWVRRGARDGAQDLGAIRRTVAGEVAVAAAVLAVTAMLVNAVPAKSALSRPYSTELEVGALLVDVTVDPAKAGPTDVHVYTLTKQGAVAEVEELTASLSLPAQDIAPLAVPLQRAGRGHFAAYGFDVPIRGTWRLTIVVRTSDIDQDRASTDVPVR